MFSYGTEPELDGGPDPDCRRVMPWERKFPKAMACHLHGRS